MADFTLVFGNTSLTLFEAVGLTTDPNVTVSPAPSAASLVEPPTLVAPLALGPTELSGPGWSIAWIS